GTTPPIPPEAYRRVVEQAVARTGATAGRTVAGSGVTVGIALTSPMLFPRVFLRPMGDGGGGPPPRGHPCRAGRPPGAAARRRLQGQGAAQPPLRALSRP